MAVVQIFKLVEHISRGQNLYLHNKFSRDDDIFIVSNI